MKESLVSRLRTARKELTEKIIVDDRFWTQLTDSCTVTDEHVELCKAKETQMKRIELLLDMLERRDDSCFQKFCHVLSQNNMDLVKKYLDIYPDAEPIVPSAQTETVSFERLHNLRQHYESLRKILEEEQTEFDKLEIANANVQGKFEEAVNDVRNRELQHRKNEESYKNDGKALEAEKVLITQLEKERDVLEAEISRRKADFDEKSERSKRLEEDLRIKTLENRKLSKRISYHRTHLSSRSLGSRSFSEDL